MRKISALIMAVAVCCVAPMSRQHVRAQASPEAPLTILCLGAMEFATRNPVQSKNGHATSGEFRTDGIPLWSFVIDRASKSIDVSLSVGGESRLIVGVEKLFIDPPDHVVIERNGVEHYSYAFHFHGTQDKYVFRLSRDSMGAKVLEVHVETTNVTCR
jgi:hypothetical protein